MRRGHAIALAEQEQDVANVLLNNSKQRNSFIRKKSTGQSNVCCRPYSYGVGVGVSHYSEIWDARSEVPTRQICQGQRTGWSADGRD